MALAAVLTVLFVAGFWLVARFVLRANPLAWGAAVLLIVGVPTAWELLVQPEAWTRWNGVFLLAVVLLPILWLLGQALRGGGPAAAVATATAPESGGGVEPEPPPE